MPARLLGLSSGISKNLSNKLCSEKKGKSKNETFQKLSFVFVLKANINFAT